MKTFLSLFALVASLSILCGCANVPTSSQIYTNHQALRVSAAQEATVINTRPVKIQPAYQSGAGYAMGGTVGAAAGMLTKNSSARWLIGAIGGSVGAIAGNAIERAVTTQDGLEIVVKLDNGQIQVITQEADVSVTPGQRVRVVGQWGNARVAPF